MPLEIVRNDITKMKVDAIVNAANSSLLGGGGVDGAIHRAAGPELLAECRILGGCRTGEAKITGGYRLPARWVIHTVGPVWKGGQAGEKELLQSCYRNALKLAAEKNCETVAFPLISAGVYGYPGDRAMADAVEVIGHFLMTHDMTVYLVVFGHADFLNGKKLMRDVQEYIDDVYVEEHLIRRPGSGNFPYERAETSAGPAGILNGVLRGKEIREPERIQALEQRYREVRKRILDCREIMDSAVHNAMGSPRDSGIYRENERMYRAARGTLAQLTQREQQLGKALRQAGWTEPVEPPDWLAGGSWEAEKAVSFHGLAGIPTDGESLYEPLCETEGFTPDLFKDAEEEANAPAAQDGFGAAVSADARPQALQDRTEAFRKKPQPPVSATRPPSDTEMDHAPCIEKPKDARPAVHPTVYAERKAYKSIQHARPNARPNPWDMLDEGFSGTLLRLIDEKGMTDAQCYKRANVDRKLFSKIRSNPDYRPSKPTVFAFAVALELPLDETVKLLGCAGFALSHSFKFDVIMEYFIKQRIYDIYQINEVLFSYDQPLLGSMAG